jgi:beta-glucanase (GH16 family)
MLVNIKYSKAQSPANDSAWVKQTSLSDEFTTLDTACCSSFWWTGTSTPDINPWGAEQNRKNNVSRSGDTLVIKADSIKKSDGWPTAKNTIWDNIAPDSVSYAYQGGAISSGAVYKFGYIEIYAKYPTGYYSLWPAFWFQNKNCGSPYFYNEIDVAECSADDADSASHMGTGYNADLADCSGSSNPSHAIQIPFSISGWHKYAIEWNANRLTWYFDGVAVRTYYDGTGASIPQQGLTLYLDFSIYPWNAWNPTCFTSGHNWTYGVGAGQPRTPTSYPQYYKVDYVRDYKLTAVNSGCTTVATNLCSLSSYYRKVYKSITTDNTCSPSINPSDWNHSYTLRATDYVLLDVPSGSNSITINPSGTGYFAIDVVPCPQ